MVLVKRQIETIDQDTFKGLANLTLIELHINKLSGEFGPNILTDLSKLKGLTLSYNKLAKINANAFKGSKNLKIINLSNNKLAGQLDARVFMETVNIQEIYLQNKTMN
jgi:Leucine-rich repeat (LRR) protein